MNYFKNFFVNDFFELLFLIFIILFIRHSFWEPFKVPTESMKPNLLVGDFVFANKYYFFLNIPFINNIFFISTLNRGDIVIFFNKKDRFVKRIISLPGDKFVYRNKNIFINDFKIKKEIFFCNYLLNKGIKCLLLEYLLPTKEYLTKIYLTKYSFKYINYFNVNVSYSNYFVIGDNRDNSYDSRFFGCVSFDKIKGKAIFIWLSFDIWKLDFRWNRILRKVL